MPIKSYLAHVVERQRDEVSRRLGRLAGCAVVPATNRNLVVLVTDTPDEAAEEALEDALGHVPGLQCLTLVAGLADPETPDPPAEDDDDPS